MKTSIYQAKALIYQYFNPECHILIETNASGYFIDGVLS